MTSASASAATSRRNCFMGLPPFGRRAPQQVFYPFPILLSKSSVVPGSEHSKKAFRLFAPFRSLPHGVPRLCRPVRRVVRPDADYGVSGHCQRLCAEPSRPHRSNREIKGLYTGCSSGLSSMSRSNPDIQGWFHGAALASSRLAYPAPSPPEIGMSRLTCGSSPLPRARSMSSNPCRCIALLLHQSQQIQKAPRGIREAHSRFDPVKIPL